MLCRDLLTCWGHTYRKREEQTYCLVPSADVIMGHRQTFSSSQLFDADHDQHWNHIHVEDPYVHLGASGSSVNESNTAFHPGNNLPIEELHCASHWSSAPRTNVFPSSSQIAPPPHNHSESSSTIDALHPSVPLNPFMAHENHAHLASSSNFVVENSSFDLSMGHGRGHYKRKSPLTPSLNERGNGSGYYCAGGSSSDVSAPLNFRQERLNGEAQHSLWESITIPPNYNSSGGGESSHRNVRSRTTFDLDADIFSAHRTPNYSQHVSSSRHSVDHSNTADLPTLGPSLPLPERNLVHFSASSHGRTVIPADSSSLSHEANPFITGSNIHNVSAHIGGYPHDLGSSRNPVVSQSFLPTPVQATRAARSCYPQRSNPPTNRVSVGSLRLGHTPPPEESLRFVPGENYSSRHQRPFSNVGWRNSDRSRSRLSTERYRALSVDALSHDRLTPGGVMIVDRSTLHGGRSLFDQHRDLRLDVDNMTYEELLALGERIGHVNTGLLENQLLICLEETIHSPNLIQGEDRCVICLEEYQNNDGIGTVKTCKHQYHIGCIKKWLSMKNLCPVCKAPALPDDIKDKGKEK